MLKDGVLVVRCGCVKAAPSCRARSWLLRRTSTHGTLPILVPRGPPILGPHAQRISAIPSERAPRITGAG
jgi:hypothetical protein